MNRQTLRQRHVLRACLRREWFKDAAAITAAVAAFGLVFGAIAIKKAGAHDHYGDWKIPGSSVSCCSERVEHDDGRVTGDCRPVRAAQDMDGNWIVYVDGMSVPVPKDKILDMQSPDGRSHWCGVGDYTYCFVPGEVRS